MKKLSYKTIVENKVEYALDYCPYRQGEKKIGVFGLGSLMCKTKCPYCIAHDDIKHTIKCNFIVLDLSVSNHLHDEIKSGKRTVVYLKINDYWIKKFMNCNNECYHAKYKKFMFCRFCSNANFNNFDAVRFHKGKFGKQTIMFECARITIEQGLVFLGAPQDEYVFNIYLGKRLQ